MAKFNNETISIIIPAYNAANWISRAIDSALNQTYTNIDIIVIDDGSSDNTHEVCNIYGNKIRYLYQPNSGVSAARNNGIINAKGNYISFLDADDELMPEMLDILIKAYEAYPNAHAAAGAHIWDSGIKRIRRPPQGWISRSNPIGLIDNFFDIYRKNHTAIWTGAVLIKRHILIDIGGFCENLHYGEDTDLWVRIGGKYQWIYVDQPIATYHHKPESSSTLRISTGEKSLSALFDENEMRKLINPPLWKAYRRFRRDRALNFARILLFEGQDALARKAISLSTPAPFTFRWLFILLLRILPYSIRSKLYYIFKKTEFPLTQD